MMTSLYIVWLICLFVSWEVSRYYKYVYSKHSWLFVCLFLFLAGTGEFATDEAELSDTNKNAQMESVSCICLQIKVNKWQCVTGICWLADGGS